MIKSWYSSIFFGIASFFLSAQIIALPYSEYDASRLFSEDGVKLIQAIENRDDGRISDLLKSGVDLNEKGYRGVNLLYWFVLSRDLRGFSVLLDLGANPDQRWGSGLSLLHVLATSNDVSFTSVILEKGVDVNVQVSGFDETPLMNSVMSSDSKKSVFGLLLEKGANPYVEDRLGRTVYSSAVLFGQFKAVRYLIGLGFVDLSDSAKSILTYAIKKKEKLNLSSQKKVDFILMKKELMSSKVLTGLN